MPNNTYTPAQMAAAIGEIGIGILENKTIQPITDNGIYTITPTSGYDGMNSVSVTVNVFKCPREEAVGNFGLSSGFIEFSASAEEGEAL